MAYIQLSDVVKRYDRNLAVDNISIHIAKGEIFGLLGPNGAGKSTTIKMIMGLLKPTSGEINIQGQSIRKEERKIKKLMGLVPQDLAIYNSMSARENVEFFGSLYGLSGKKLKEMAEQALAFTGLVEKKNEKPKQFSGGMKRRLNIACAIVHRPEIVIMDEPTVGIDPQSRNHILESVRELSSQGTTIIYTSHYMDEVETLCDRVGIMDHGKLIALGNKNELKKQVGTLEKIIIEALDIRYNPIEEVKQIDAVKSVSVNENTIEINTSCAQEILQEALLLLSRANVKVRSISLKEPDLESVFLTLTGRQLRD